MTASNDTTHNLRQIFLQDTPLMDVRAPVEFQKGSFPNATNLPLLDDQQRHDIGVRYAEAGEESAIALGLELATPDIREQRLQAWADFTRSHPDGYLYCFRGGLRSRTTQHWLRDSCIDYPLIPGGYKAMRRFLLNEMYALINEGHIIVVSASTGSGKTELIHAWPQSVDLEGLANHKGSAFGRNFSAQPTQIDWEHAFTIDWMRRQHVSDQPVLMEDESRLIGKIFLPPELQTLLAQAPEVQLEATLQQRIERLRQDYVQPIVDHFQAIDRETAPEQISEHIQHNLLRIRKRLGGERHQTLHESVPNAVSALLKQQDWEGFDGIIERLLTDYYDPMYCYHRSRSERTTLASGDHAELLDWLARGQS